MPLSDADKATIAHAVEVYEELYRQWRAMDERVLGYAVKGNAVLYPDHMRVAYEHVLRNLA